MNERIYVVTDKTTGERHLRIATHPSTALRNIVSKLFEVRASNTMEVAKLMLQGITPIAVSEESDVNQ